MVGIDTIQVSDRTFVVPASNIDDDFTSMVNVHKVVPTVFSDFDVQSRYEDFTNNPDAIGIEVDQKTYAWSTPADSKYIIVEYTVSTLGTQQNMFAGIYCDWDLGNAVDNKAEYDATRKMGYVYSTGSSSIYVGVKQLTPGANNYYAIENDGSAGSVGIYNGFTEEEKYRTLSTARPAAGQSGTGGDVSFTISAGPYTVNSLDSIKVAFALLAGDDLNDLNAVADAAETKYNSISSVSEVSSTFTLLENVYPNPAIDELTVNYVLSSRSDVLLSIYDLSGKRIVERKISDQIPGRHQFAFDISKLSKGAYILQMESGSYTGTSRFTVAK